MKTAGKDVERLLTGHPPLTRKAWRRMRGWYRAAVDHAPPPARFTLEQITANCVELYRAVPPPLPPGENTPTSVMPAHVYDYVPTEEEVEWVVRRLKGNSLGGLYRMYVNHLREWLREHQVAEAVAEERGPAKGGEEGAEREKSKWELVVELAQTAFRDRVLAEEATWKAVVLIMKEGDEHRGIGLVELMWKEVAVIINFRCTASITYHNYLHGFRMGHGTGTTTPEVKLIQQLTEMREEVLHAILMYLHNKYNALDRSRCLEILEGYGVGTRALYLLRRYWERLQMVARAGGYYGEHFHGERVMNQGDPLSPTIFNVVVGTVVRHWESMMAEGVGGDDRDDSSDDEVGQPEIRKIRVRNNKRRRTEEGLKVQEEILYADGGMVAFTNLGWLQTEFEMLTGLFDRVGLKKNVRKTMGVVCHPFRADGGRQDEAYNRRMIGSGRSYKDIQQEQISCPEYRKDLMRGSLAAHCQNQHGVTKGGTVQEGKIEGRGDEPRTYRMVFLAKAGLRHCPVEGCSGRASTQASMRVHFWHWNVWNIVVILEGGNPPPPTVIPVRHAG